MNKKHMMKSAHKIAKGIVDFVEDYAIAFKLALKEVWRLVKNYNKKRFTVDSIFNAQVRLATPKVERNIDGVPAWIIRKNCTNEEAYAVLNECEGSTVERETEKAVLVKFFTPYGAVKCWSPKSVLVA